MCGAGRGDWHGEGRRRVVLGWGFGVEGGA